MAIVVCPNRYRSNDEPCPSFPGSMYRRSSVLADSRRDATTREIVTAVRRILLRDSWRFSSGRNCFPSRAERKMTKTRRLRSRGYMRGSVYESGAVGRSGWVHEGRGGLWGFVVGRSRNYTVTREQKSERFVRPSRNFMAPRAGPRGARFNIN